MYQREGRVKHFLSSGLIYGYWEHKSFRSPRTPSPVIYSPENISKSKLGGTKNTFFGCGQICEDSRNMNHKSKTAKCQSCKGVGALFKFSQVQMQHQHFNICIRSALGAHSSQLSSMIPVMQNFVEPLCICPVYKPEIEIEPKCLHYGSIKGHSIQDCNRLKFHISEVYLKVRKEFKRFEETLLTGIPDTVTRSLAVCSTLSKFLQPVSKHHSVKRST